MSHRHIPRQPERGDVRMHDPQPPQVHPHHIHPLINGPNPVPSSSNGTAISPAIQTAAAPNGAPAGPTSIINKLNSANEQTWLLIGRVAEQMGDLEHALSAYENALRHNPSSVSGLTQVAGIARIKENYPKAVDYFQRVLQIEENNGEIWSALGHCYLMQDDLQKAYSAYQQALYLLPNPKEDPKLWYGIGILYDRYGSLDHAEEAFSSVLRMCKDFDKENEILFRLGIIYKQQGKFDDSLGCFDRILRNPPSPLAHADIWFQIGHVFEQQKNHRRARDAYERVVEANPQHAKVLQQLGWLYHQDGSSFQNHDIAIQYFTKSLEADPSDAQSWYLLGRAYMAGQKYNKAYEAYQQAVYRDGRNPTFWCSIGVLYFQINQYRDALDAYSRAIRINPYISEVWFDLGSLYESCNNQITDAIDAYARAAELDPSNVAIAQRLQLLKNAQATGSQLPAAPGPQDVHPTAYASSVVPPPANLNGPPLMLQPNNMRPPFRSDSRGPPIDVGMSSSSTQVNPSSRLSPPAPFRGGPPPPVILDETRHIPPHTPLAPMEVDRPPHHNPREYPISRGDLPRGGVPVGHQSLLLQHPLPSQGPSDDPRNGTHAHHSDPYYNRARPPSRSVSPTRPRTPGAYSGYPPSRQPVGPAQPSGGPPQRSPRAYHHRDLSHTEAEPGWDRRPPHGEWEREPERRRDYPSHPGQPSSSYYTHPRSPRGPSPPTASPRVGHPSVRYWDNKPGAAGLPLPHFRPSSPPHGHPHAPGLEPTRSRYDPRQDARDSGDYDERVEGRGYPVSSEGIRSRNGPPPAIIGPSNSRPESPHAEKSRRRKEREELQAAPQHPHEHSHPPSQAVQPQFPPPSSTTPSMTDLPKKERKRRTNNSSKRKEESSEEGQRGASSFNKHQYAKGPSSPENSSNSSSSRSIQPSPTSATPRQVIRTVDEDYDEGVADTLIVLSKSSNPDGPTQSPTISSQSRHTMPSPRVPSHRNSISSTHASPPVQATPLKRALSPAPDESSDNTKRSRLELSKRRISSPSGGKRTPITSTRPSPTPYRTQPASHSPEMTDHFPPSPLPLQVVLPPHPKPMGIGNAQSLAPGGGGSVERGSSGSSSSSAHPALPPIATLSPSSRSPSPTNHSEREDKMHVDVRSLSPPTTRVSKMLDVGSSRSPSTKQSQSPPVEKEPSS